MNKLTEYQKDGLKNLARIQCYSPAFPGRFYTSAELGVYSSTLRLLLRRGLCERKTIDHNHHNVWGYRITPKGIDEFIGLEALINKALDEVEKL